MRTTVTIDDALYLQALELSDPDTDRADLFQIAIQLFVRIQTAKRLALLGGTVPEMADVSRRRPEAESK